MTAKRKHLILSKQRHRISRDRYVREVDYRWWRYVDEEPAEGFVDTSYTEKHYPYAQERVGRALPKTKSWLSNTQLRRRLARSGIPLSMVTEALHAVIAARALTFGEFKASGWQGPLELSLESVIGPHATRRVMVGVREPFVVMDEFWSLMQFMPPILPSLMRSTNSAGAVPAEVAV